MNITKIAEKVIHIIVYAKEEQNWPHFESHNSFPKHGPTPVWLTFQRRADFYF